MNFYNNNRRNIMSGLKLSNDEIKLIKNGVEKQYFIRVTDEKVKEDDLTEGDAFALSGYEYAIPKPKKELIKLGGGKKQLSEDEKKKNEKTKKENIKNEQYNQQLVYAGMIYDEKTWYNMLKRTCDKMIAGQGGDEQKKSLLIIERDTSKHGKIEKTEENYSLSIPKDPRSGTLFKLGRGKLGGLSKNIILKKVGLTGKESTDGILEAICGTLKTAVTVKQDVKQVDSESQAPIAPDSSSLDGLIPKVSVSPLPAVALRSPPPPSILPDLPGASSSPHPASLSIPKEEKEDEISKEEVSPEAKAAVRTAVEAAKAADIIPKDVVPEWAEKAIIRSQSLAATLIKKGVPEGEIQDAIKDSLRDSRPHPGSMSS